MRNKRANNVNARSFAGCFLMEYPPESAAETFLSFWTRSFQRTGAVRPGYFRVMSFWAIQGLVGRQTGEAASNHSAPEPG